MADFMDVDRRRHKAATKIAAHYKAYRIRKNLTQYLHFRKNRQPLMDQQFQLKERLTIKQREYEFISQLDAFSVVTLNFRKRDFAATKIQKVWRGRSVRKNTILQERRDNTFMLRIVRKMQRIYRANRNKKILRERKREKELDLFNTDHFYAPIEKDIVEEYHASIRQKRNGYNEQLHYQMTRDQLNEEWANKYSKFLEDQVEWEIRRRKRLNLHNDIMNMIYFLSQNSGDLKKGKIFDFEDATTEEKLQAKIKHKKKLDAYLSKQPWQKYLEEDDEDLEGDILFKKIDDLRNKRFSDAMERIKKDQEKFDHFQKEPEKENFIENDDLFS